MLALVYSLSQFFSTECGGSVVAQLERWTCNLEVLSLSPSLNASWIYSW